VVLLPSRRRRCTPAVVYCHPSGGSAGRLLTDQGAAELQLLEAIADDGFAVIAPDMGGPSDTWGNDLAVTRIAEARSHLHRGRLADPGPTALVGMSMGALDIMSCARSRPAEVAALVAAAPVCDLDALRRLNADDLTANIDRAWGLGPDDALPARADPFRNTAELVGVPWLAFYAADDPLVPPESVRQFSAAVGGEAVDLGPVGHTGIIDAVPIPRVIEFLRRCCA
jgi:pimeloyl-ACP methyl ester carboxylesterase